jgi:hypothetical protein
MAARPESQTLILSTMGTVSDSDAWNELVRQGREATEDDATRIAYLEYSAPDEPAVFDPTRWHEWMPALGYFLPPDEIADNMALLTPADFVRAWGNMTVETLAVVFPQEWIERAWRSALPPAQRFTVAIEVNEEPAGATIAAGYELEPGVMAVRTLEWRYGSPAWVPKVIEAMLSRRDLDAIVADFGGPTRQLLAALTVLAEGRLVALIDRKPRQLGADTAGFYDALKEGTVQLERNEYLEAALRGAYRKDIGDLWIPHRRRMAVDASPLLSAVMAYGVAKEYALTPRLPAIY